MTADETRWQRLIQGLRSGDAQIVREFCAQHGSLLEQLADKHLSSAVQRRVGPDDIAQSVCRTFLRRAQDGQFQLAGNADMWRLLGAITLTKVREQMRFHLRHRRALHQEIPLTDASDQTNVSGLVPKATDPSGGEMAEFSDQFQQLLASLDPEERQVLEMKCQECTHEEIATKLGSSVRTVNRILKRVQSHLEKYFAQD
jgi:RNA polymerase sigma factor (sigma-70 family)